MAPQPTYTASDIEEGMNVDGRARILGWLRAGVPLSLLLDLADPAGPDSEAIAREERPAELVSLRS